MEEQKVFAIQLDGLFPEAEDSPRVHGTAGEILERIADEWGLVEDPNEEQDFPLDGVYPSSRAYKAHQMLEDRMGKPGAFHEPDALIDAMILDGLARPLTDAEFEEWMEEAEMEEYEEARGELDDEWSDGRWES